MEIFTLVRVIIFSIRRQSKKNQFFRFFRNVNFRCNYLNFYASKIGVGFVGKPSSRSIFSACQIFKLGPQSKLRHPKIVMPERMKFSWPVQKELIVKSACTLFTFQCLLWTRFVLHYYDAHCMKNWDFGFLKLNCRNPFEKGVKMSEILIHCLLFYLLFIFNCLFNGLVPPLNHSWFLKGNSLIQFL